LIISTFLVKHKGVEMQHSILDGVVDAQQFVEDDAGPYFMMTNRKWS
jgi:hypothetical protein